MGNCILKFDTSRGPRYLIWSSISDAPVTFGMTEQQLKKWWKDEYGRSGEFEFARAFTRVGEVGTSSMRRGSVREVMKYNRAGRNEECLTYEEIVEFFVVKKKDPPEGVGKPWNEDSSDDD